MIEAELKTWMTSVVLPFWGTAGVDSGTGAFHERFHPDASPDLTAVRRLRVQARQIYVFSHAAALGWAPDGRQIALTAFDRLMATYWAADGAPGFVQAVTPDGSIQTPLRDAYDHAFVVLALAWLSRATGEPRVEAALNRTLAFIDAALTDPDGVLFEDDKRSLPRRQNPQMHWFEAALGLKIAADHPSAPNRALRGFKLFQDSLYDPRSSLIGEYYDDDWRPAAGEAGDAVEPGHLAEWSWLMRQAQKTLGMTTAPIADALLAAALPHTAPATGLLWDEIARDGGVRLRSSRSWPMTELAKACLAKAETGDVAARAEARSALRLLDQYFLRKPFAAGWLDRVTEDGTPMSQMVSGSTLYHIFVAITEADRVLSRD